MNSRSEAEVLAMLVYAHLLQRLEEPPDVKVAFARQTSNQVLVSRVLGVQAIVSSFDDRSLSSIAEDIASTALESLAYLERYRASDFFEHLNMPPRTRDSVRRVKFEDEPPEPTREEKRRAERLRTTRMANAISQMLREEQRDALEDN